MAFSESIKRPFRHRILFSLLGILLPAFIIIALAVEIIHIPALIARSKQELINATNLLSNTVHATASVSIRLHLKAQAEQNQEIANHYLKLSDEGHFSRDKVRSDLRDIFLSREVGTSGYLYCINSQGIAIIHPNPGVEGTDNTIFPFVRDQMEQKEGYLEYDWKNPGEAAERPKALYMVYFEPFDWIISVTSYRAEFTELINPEDFKEAVLSSGFGKSGYQYIYSAEGDLLVYPDPDADGNLEVSQLPVGVVEKMITKRKGIIEYKPGSSSWINLHTKLAAFKTLDDLGWIIISSVDSSEIMEPVKVTRVLTYGGMLLIILLAVPTSILLSRRLSKPVENMVECLDYNTLHNVNNPLPVEGQDELSYLAREFNEYMKAFENQNKLLQAEKMRYRNLFETSPDGIFLMSGIQIIDCNPETCRIFKSTRENLIGKSIVELSPPLQDKQLDSNSEAKRIIDSLKESEIVSFDWTHLNLEGEIFETEVRLKKFDEIIDENILVAFIRDITERKEISRKLDNYREHLEIQVKERTEELETTNEELISLNKELYSQQEELEQALKRLQEAQARLVQAEKMTSLGLLASGVAHEINNPLNFIQGGVVGLEFYHAENLPEHHQKIEPLISAIKEGVKRASGIVKSLSHYNRGEEQPLENIKINDIIENCLTILHSQIKNKIEITRDYATDLECINCNEGKMHQAFLNILLNSIHAMDENGKLMISTRKDELHMIIVIEDNGCGISPENLSRIFDPFFTTKETGKGTGLGLSITQNIIIEHHGAISVNSTEGIGTTVTITLPYC